MKNNIMIIYKSSTGFTKKYAEMISEEIPCTLVDYRKTTAEMMSGYNLILFGSRAHAGRIDGYNKFKKMFQKSTAKKFVLFVTGAMPATAKETISEFWAQNLPGKERTRIPHFYLPGGLCYERMSLSDKCMMKAAGIMMKKKKHKTAQDREFEQAISGSYDISDKKYIMPLVSFLKKNL